MSASKGNVINTWDWTSFAPPEALKLFFLRKPKSQSNLMASELLNKRYNLIDNDLDIPKLTDDLIDYSKLYYDIDAQIIMTKLKIEPNKVEMYKRLYQLCQIQDALPYEIPRTLPTSTLIELLPLEKLIGEPNLIQMSLEIAKKMFKVDQINESDKQTIELALARTKTYLRLYAPASVKFEITDTISPEIRDQISPPEKRALEAFLQRFEPKEWEEKSLEQEIYSIGKELLQNGKKLFQVLYKVLLGKPSGPRLASLLLKMDKNWVINRIAALFP
jgi:lysyl-tRNA synthetase class 1